MRLLLLLACVSSVAGFGLKAFENCQCGDDCSMPTDPQSMSFAIVQGKRQADCTCGTTEPDCNLYGKCQPVMCKMYCANGWAKDQDGCDMCQCATPALAAEGETCGGFDEMTGRQFPDCARGLSCVSSGMASIPGAGKRCVAMAGGLRDENGCIGSAGYQWCDALSECIRPWETDCVAAPTLGLEGGQRDENGCIGSAGYSWCDALSECIRPWETDCVAVAAPTLGLVGGDQDDHGCLSSAGYQWCDALSECIRPWETDCVAAAAPSCDECMNRQRQGENIACTMC